MVANRSRGRGKREREKERAKKGRFDTNIHQTITVDRVASVSSIGTIEYTFEHTSDSAFHRTEIFDYFVRRV